MKQGEGHDSPSSGEEDDAFEEQFDEDDIESLRKYHSRHIDGDSSSTDDADEVEEEERDNADADADGEDNNNREEWDVPEEWLEENAIELEAIERRVHVYPFRYVEGKLRRFGALPDPFSGRRRFGAWVTLLEMQQRHTNLKALHVRKWLRNVPYVSPYFVAACMWGARMAIATLLASLFVLFRTTSVQVGPAAFLAPVVSIIFVAPTLGRTMLGCWLGLSGGVVGCSLGLAVIYAFNRVHVALVALGLFVSCFFLAYMERSPAWKKLALIGNVYIVLAFSSNPDLSLRDSLVSFMFAASIAAAAAIVSLILPFPTTSVNELENATKANLFAISRYFTTLLQYYRTPQEKELRRLHLWVKANMLAQALKESQATIVARLGEVEWERPIMKAVGYTEYLGISGQMAEHLAGLQRAVKVSFFSHRHKKFRRFLHQPLGILRYAMDCHLSKVMDNALKWRLPGTKAKQPADQREVYKKTVKTESADNQKGKGKGKKKEKTKKEDKSPNNKEALSASKAEAVKKQREASKLQHHAQSYPDLSAYKAIGLIDAMAELMQQLVEARYQIYKYARTDRDPTFDLNDTLAMNAAIFHMLSLSHLALSLENLRFGWDWDIIKGLRTHLIMPWIEWILEIGISLFWRKPKRLYMWVTRKSPLPTWQEAKKWYWNLRVKGALQMALAIVLASLLVFIPSWHNYFTFGQWAAYTVALTMERGRQGGTVRALANRLQGTVCGGLVGYLIVVSTDNNVYGSTTLLCAWVFVCGYVRYNPVYSYAGMVAAFTAVYIMFLGGVNLTLGSPVNGSRTLVLDRIEATLLGIFATFIINILWPIRASPQLRKSILRKTLPMLRDMTHAVFGGFLHPPVTSEEKQQEKELEKKEFEEEEEAAREMAVEMEMGMEGDIEMGYLSNSQPPAFHHYHTEHKTVIGISSGLRTLFAAQAMLIEDANAEPRLWRAPFPGKAFSDILVSQQSLLRSLSTIDGALRIGSESGDVVFTAVFSPMRELLQSIETDIRGSMDEIILELRLGSYSGKKVGYAPLRTRITLKNTERAIAGIMINLVRAFRKNKDISDENSASTEGEAPAATPTAKTTKFAWSERKLAVSNVDVITFTCLIFGLRELTDELHHLWESVCALIQTERLYRMI